jgi:hypothetical protein
MSEDEIVIVLEKVGARFRGIQHVGKPEFIDEADVILFEHECLPRNVVTAIRVSDLDEMQLLLHLASARARWVPKPQAQAAD